MKFNTANKEEKKQAFSYFMKLANKKQIISVTKVSPSRSLSQNSYLHLIIGAFGAHFGYTMEEAKSIYKDVNKGIYWYRKKGRVFVRSSADLSKEEMAKSIDRFMQASADQGYALPLATDKEWLMQIENEIERSNYYL
jgi:hypothetical protein